MRQSDYLNGKRSNFEKLPVVSVADTADGVAVGWTAVMRRIFSDSPKSVAIETYQGVDIDRWITAVGEYLDAGGAVFDTRSRMKSAERIREMVYPDVTDDRVFGFLTRLRLREFFANDGQSASETTDSGSVETSSGPRSEMEPIVWIGPGAVLVAPKDAVVVYVDMPRWEIQQRQRAHRVDNLGVNNRNDDPKALYKQSFFVDWRVLDRHKKEVLPDSTLYIEHVDDDRPVAIATTMLFDAFDRAVDGPFELQPFFDPGVWGGHWMQAVFDLPDDKPNYAWCFNCVPEENSIRFSFGEITIETPSINLVFFRTRRLLGDPVHARFGDEFPIRFDFLDTMGGQNLSFQVHPLTEYIQEHFGMHYTQDESYYILDAKPGAVVYLGLKEGVEPDHMREDLDAAQRGERPFPAEDHVETWPVQKHDHYLIPAGTPHCSGTDSLVLEISATPFIFTFKLWDWGRLDLDGAPRPINIEHGWPNIQWERTSAWTRSNLVNRVETLASGPGWKEERTGLHEREFIETRRYWVSTVLELDTGGMASGSVNVLNLVEGREATVESPAGAFSPFVVHYAETFIVPASVGTYNVRPSGESVNETIGLVRAFVRH
jgi:mannose-6-phosphate isomerase class I